MFKMTAKKPPNFKIEFPGSDEVKQRVKSKMNDIREKMTRSLGKPVNNTLILEVCLDEWIKQHRKPARPTQKSEIGHSTFVGVTKDNTEQKLFITAETSLQKCIEVAEAHGRHCNGNLSLISMDYKGHAITSKIRCSQAGKKHEYRWSSSPYLPSGEYLVNHRMVFGFTTSGMLPSHYSRFSGGAGIGSVDQRKRDRIIGEIYTHVKEESKSSTEEALLEEMASYGDDPDDVVNMQLDGEDEMMHIAAHPGINIATDARHGWRKNAKDTSVVAIGDQSHKALRVEHVTKRDDSVSQRHERIGTERIYDYLEASGTFVNVHAHDSNATVDKIAHARACVNQNDTWHGMKSLKKALTPISTGPLYKQGTTWHSQLFDKVEPVLTHARHVMRNCDNDADILRNKLLVCVDHYQNRHGQCSTSSRCQNDAKYEPSCVVLTAPKAVTLLKDTLTKSLLFKKAESYYLAKDTYYVESFNNVMNIFQDKRIVFSDMQYDLRSELAVCHWNENVDREYTSISQPRNQQNKRQKAKKVLKRPTFRYRENMWRRYMTSIFE